MRAPTPFTLPEETEHIAPGAVLHRRNERLVSVLHLESGRVLRGVLENVFTVHPGPRQYPFGRSAALRHLPIAWAMGCVPRLASHPEWAFARLPAGQ